MPRYVANRANENQQYLPALTLYAMHDWKKALKFCQFHQKRASGFSTHCRYLIVLITSAVLAGRQN